MLLVEFPIQLARVNSTQAKVQLILLLCGNYLRAHSLFTPVVDFGARNANNYMSF